jgi:hypothetical protein
MADSTDSTSSWPSLVAQINTTFNLVRDAFGYTLPGAVFLAIGIISGSYSLCRLSCLLQPYTLPPWAAFILVVAACYAAGSVMAAMIYMPFGVLKYIVWMVDRHLPCYVIDTSKNSVTVDGRTVPVGRKIRVTANRARRHPAVAIVALNDGGWPEGSWRDWLLSNPTEVSAKTLEIRMAHRDLFNTLDRRETLNVMAGSMAAALIAGYLVFHSWRWDGFQIIKWGGILELIQFLTGLSHIRRVLKAVHMSKIPDPKPTPDFPQLLNDLIDATTKALNKFAS